MWKRSSFVTIFREKVQCQLHLPEIPSKNCPIADCTVSRKDKGISIFKTSLRNNEFNKKWSQNLFNTVLKYRRRDKSLNERFESHKFFIC